MKNSEAVAMLKSLQRTYEDSRANGGFEVLLNKRIEALQLAIEALEWIPVSERMPESTRAVLVRCPENKCDFTATYKEGRGWHYFGGFGGALMHFVSHWKPLTPLEEA